MGEQYVLLRGFKIVGVGSFGSMLSEVNIEYRKLEREGRLYTAQKLKMYKRSDSLPQWLLEING